VCRAGSRGKITSNSILIIFINQPRDILLEFFVEDEANFEKTSTACRPSGYRKTRQNFILKNPIFLRVSVVHNTTKGNAVNREFVGRGPTTASGVA